MWELISWILIIYCFSEMTVLNVFCEAQCFSKFEKKIVRFFSKYILVTATCSFYSCTYFIIYYIKFLFINAIFYFIIFSKCNFFLRLFLALVFDKLFLVCELRNLKIPILHDYSQQNCH